MIGLNSWEDTERCSIDNEPSRRSEIRKAELVKKRKPALFFFFSLCLLFITALTFIPKNTTNLLLFSKLVLPKHTFSQTPADLHSHRSYLWPWCACNAKKKEKRKKQRGLMATITELVLWLWFCCSHCCRKEGRFG